MFPPARGHEEFIDESVAIFVLLYTEVSRFFLCAAERYRYCAFDVAINLTTCKSFSPSGTL